MTALSNPCSPDRAAPDALPDGATLDAFLSDVDGFSPGSNMFFPGIKDDAIRPAVIDYLKALQ